MIELKNKVIGGFSWMLAAQFSRQVIRFLLVAVLARILSPQDFGLIGIALFFSGLVVSVWNVIGSALIQKTDLDVHQWSSVFWILLAVGAFFAMIFYYSRFQLSEYFEEPGLASLIPIISIQMIISATLCVPMSLLRRSLEFKRIAAVDVGSIIFGGIVALYLALNFRDASALAWQATAMSFYIAAGSWWLLKKRPLLTYSNKHLLDLAGYSLPLFGSTIISYLIRTGDRLVVGKFIGSHSLGLYSISNSTMRTPADLIGVVAGKVMFPSLSLIKDDLPRYRSGYMKTLGMFAIFLFPVMLLGFILGKEIVLIVLSEKWIEAVPIFKIFCLIGLLQPLNKTFSWIFMSQGKTQVQFYWFLGSGALFILAIIIGSQYGVKGAAFGVLTHVFLTTPIHYKIAGSFIGVNLTDAWKSLKEVVFAAVALFTVTYPVHLFLEPRSPMALRLILCTIIGMSVYLAVLAVSDSDAANEIKSTIKVILPSRR